MKVEDKNNLNQTKINDKSNLTGSYLKSSTSENSRRDYKDIIDKKEVIDNMSENINEELPETKRRKIPKKFSYNSNNITYINGKYKTADENIDDEDDEGLLRETNDSINSLKGLEFYRYKRESNIQYQK